MSSSSGPSRARTSPSSSVVSRRSSRSASVASSRSRSPAPGCCTTPSGGGSPPPEPSRQRLAAGRRVVRDAVCAHVRRRRLRLNASSHALMTDTIDRRGFLGRLAMTVAAVQLGCTTGGSTAAGTVATPAVAGGRRLQRVGIQLYSLRDDARRDLERTLADIAAIGYRDVEMLGSMDNFGMPPARIREVLDRNGLRAPSTHVGGNALDDMERQLEIAGTLGHRYLIVASLPIQGQRTLDDYR